MDIQHAILGLLSIEKLTGYDIKKRMQSSLLMYWTGNNSQVYKALAQLLHEGWVTAELRHGDASPTRKIYTITQSGRKELHTMSLIPPEPPEMRKPFLIQLAFGQSLTRSELEPLLEQYEGEVMGLLLAVKEQPVADGSPYLSALSQAIANNCRMTFESELAWVKNFRNTVLPLAPETKQQQGEVQKMEFTTIQKDGKTYVKVISGQVKEERDGMDLLNTCAYYSVNRLMLPGQCLSEEFLRLSTRLLGLVLGKLTQYRVKTVAIIPEERQVGKLRDFILETNRGNEFRVYPDMEQAEKWLLEGGTMFGD